MKTIRMMMLAVPILALSGAAALAGSSRDNTDGIGQSTYGVYRVDYDDAYKYYSKKCERGKEWACNWLDDMRYNQRHYYDNERHYYYNDDEWRRRHGYYPYD